MNLDGIEKYEFDGDRYYWVGQWSLTWDKHMDAPVMLHFHSTNSNNGYYLKSDCVTICQLVDSFSNPSFLSCQRLETVKKMIVVAMDI